MQRRQTDTRIERERRVNEVLTIRLAGGRLRDIILHAAEQGWNVTSRTLKRYIESADKIVLNDANEDRQRILARHLGRREMLFARALKTQDIPTALKVLDSECKLLGLFPDKREQNGKSTNNVAILVGAIPALQRALESLAPPAGGDLVIESTAVDDSRDVPIVAELVPRTADDPERNG